MVQYLTLEEAAQFLGIPPEQLKRMAERGDVRPFRDRGTMRFRSQEIEELARRQGGSSDQEMQIHGMPAPRPADSPTPRKKSALRGPADPDSERVDIGREPPRSALSGGSQRSGKVSSRSKLGGPASPPPKPSSDSEVRLVADGNDLGFHIASDSDVKLEQDPGPATPRKSSMRSSALSKPHSDSSVRIVGLEEKQSDSDAKLHGDSGRKTPSSVKSSLGMPPDSKVRLEATAPASSRRSKIDPGPEAMLTEEIDLDAELRKAEEAARAKGSGSKSGLKPQAAQLPTTSPFELSNDDVAAVQKPAAEPEQTTDSSDDFDLTPAPAAPNEFTLGLADDDEVSLGTEKSSAPESGINLQEPADSGINLEQDGSDEIDFELSLDAEATTPKPAPQAAEDDDSGSEFELSLDADTTPRPAAKSESDSEFELTLDDTGGLAPMEEEERDIFETDFEVPALEEESSSEAMALDPADAELESSDFDLALGDEELADDESASHVVALEDDEEAAPTPRRGRRVAALEDEEEVDELLSDTAAEEEEEGAPVGAVAAAPAQWGAFPALVLIPCVLVMFIVGLMGYELIHGMWGYHRSQKVSGFVVEPLSRLFSGTDEGAKE